MAVTDQDNARAAVGRRSLGCPPDRPLRCRSACSVWPNPTADGYYTSRAGLLEELGYTGNTALASFPACDAAGTLEAFSDGNHHDDLEAHEAREGVLTGTRFVSFVGFEIIVMSRRPCS